MQATSGFSAEIQELPECILVACDKCEVMLLEFSLETNISHSVTSAGGQKHTQTGTVNMW